MTVYSGFVNNTLLAQQGAFGSYAGAYTPSTGQLLIPSSVSIGTPSPATSALLTMSSTTQGLLPPSMTTVQKNAISSPASGLVVYDNTLNDLQFYNGAAWTSVIGGITIAGNSGTTTASSFTITTGSSDANGSALFTMSSGTLTLTPTDSNGNTNWGSAAASGTSGATQNSIYGFQAGKAIIGGSDNQLFGYQAGLAITSGGHNSIFGRQSYINGNGTYITIFGGDCGNNLTGTEHSNTYVGYGVTGTTGESNVLRICSTGTSNGQVNLCYIAGITGATPTSGNTPQVVLCDNAGNLCPISSSTSGYVLTSTGSTTPSFQARAASSISITGDTGGAQTGAAFTFAGGTTGLSFGGATDTFTLTFAGITANGGTVNLGTDNASNAVNIGVGATARVVHIANSAAAHTVVLGTTTSSATTTINAPSGGMTLTGVYGASPSTPQMMIISSAGAVGSQAIPSGVGTLDGNSGSATGSTVTITTGASNANGTATFSGSSATLSLNTTDSNANVGWGSGCMASIVPASSYANVGFGKNTLNAATTNTYNNTVYGAYGAPLLNAGTYNTLIGYNVAPNLTTGSYNLILSGYNNGYNYMGSESSNILISSNGVTSESNTFRVADTTGTGPGEINAVYIQGIYGKSPSSPEMMIIDSAGQLGSQAIPGGGTSVIVTATVSSLQSNVTGDGTDYTITFNNVLNNKGSALSGTTFTAPTTGTYQVSLIIGLEGLLISHSTGQIAASINSGAYYYFPLYVNPYNLSSSGNLWYGGSFNIYLTATDTITFGVEVSGGTKTVSLLGAALSGGGSASSLGIYSVGF